jgi:magnesium-transporting ATPase (P-type)
MKQSNSLQANHEELKQKFPARKKDLLTLCQKARDRDEFCEDLYFLEELNGPSSLVQNLGVNPKNGVAASEIKDRELQYGTNKAKKIPPKGIFELIWEALEDTILRILILAAIVSIVVNVATADAEERNIAWIDGVAILVAVFIAVSVTSIMNYKRDREFQRMNNMADEKKLFTVIRDGKPVDINQSKLVVGDVVKITEGMDIPVDGLIIEAHDITADHSSLTGETDPIKKGAFQLCLDARNKVVAAGLQEKN